MNRNVTILVIILAVLVIAGYLIWLRSRFNETPTPTSVISPTVFPTMAVEPTMEASPTASASPSGAVRVTPKLTPTKVPTKAATGSGTVR